MKTLTFVVVLVCANISLLAETKTEKPQNQQSVTSPKSNKIVDSEKPKVPLHQHPTLVKMLKRNNELRIARKLRPHKMNERLTKAAQDHAWFMARTGQFSHFSNGDPSKRAKKHGFDGSIRENIAAGQISVVEAFQDWKNSSGHWQSIISNTTEAGFGYAIAKDGQTYWVAVYGTPYKTKKPASANPATAASAKSTK